jgi:hypothetical protein
MALDVLVDVAENGSSEAARVSAANAILDRGYGRPIQGVNIGHQPTIFDELTHEMMVEMYNEEKKVDLSTL